MRCEEDEVGTTNYFPPPKMPLRVFLGSEGRRISFCSQITRYVFIYMIPLTARKILWRSKMSP